jgi:hypothetical protein
MVKDEAGDLVAHLVGPRVRIEKVAPPVFDVCRCGARMFRGVPRFAVSNPPLTIRHLLNRRAFCSLRCVRAFLLESMAEIEPLDAPDAQLTLGTLREVYLDMARTVEELRFDLTNPTA